MRRLLIVALTVFALAACGSSAATPGSSTSSGPGSSATSSATTAGARCGPAKARTLGASRTARVYVQSGAVYGCAAGGRRSYLLGHASVCINSDRVGPVVVAGRMAAYAVTTCGVDTGSATVVVRRLSDGAHLFSHAAADAAGPEGYVAVTAIVATPAGAVAWIAHAHTIVGNRSVTGVYTRSGSNVSKLDSGNAIQLSSLRLSGSTVSWQDGSGRRSARLS
ncbi:MAG: hypothetical protein ACRDNK_16315 [Solirubrobacteraceae bacterium]